MDFFKHLSYDVKKRIVRIWKAMNEKDKKHFVNQVALLFTVLGINVKSRELVVDIIERLIKDNSKNLSDFGIYLEELNSDPSLKKAKLIIEDYRFKHGLAMEPTRSLNLKN